MVFSSEKGVVYPLEGLMSWSMVDVIAGWKGVASLERAAEGVSLQDVVLLPPIPVRRCKLHPGLKARLVSTKFLNTDEKRTLPLST